MTEIDILRGRIEKLESFQAVILDKLEKIEHKIDPESLHSGTVYSCLFTIMSNIKKLRGKMSQAARDRLLDELLDSAQTAIEEMDILMHVTRDEDGNPV